jgi:hypothetical protein
MRAILVRLEEGNNQTLGELNVYSGIERLFSCKTLELPYVMNLTGISCIPKGNYTVVPRYSEKYKNHYHILDVHNRTHILIHVGNYKTQTEGCILIGKSFAYINDDELLDISSSRKTLKELIKVAPEGFKLDVI